MKTVNFALVGYGNIAKVHAAAAYNANLFLNLNFELSLKTVFTRTLRKVPPKTLNVTDMTSILNDPDIHFIDICSTNDSHLPYIRLAADFNKAIYCEKPVTESAEHTQLALDIIEENNVNNAVALVYRFTPVIQLLKKLMEADTLGRIIRFKATMYHKSYLDPARKGRWRTLANSGGGAHLDLGIHLIDIIHFTLGKINQVEAKSTIFFKDRSEVDEITECHFILDNEMTGDLEVSRIYGSQKQSTVLTVYGEKGSYTFDSLNPTLLAYYEFETDQTTLLNCKNYPETLKYYAGIGELTDLHMGILSAFADEIANHIYNPLIPRFKDAYLAQKVVEASYQASQTKQLVKIK